MKLSFRWYGPEDPISIGYIRQIPNMHSIVTAVYDVPPGELWSREPEGSHSDREFLPPVYGTAGAAGESDGMALYAGIQSGLRRQRSRVSGGGRGILQGQEGTAKGVSGRREEKENGGPGDFHGTGRTV